MADIKISALTTQTDFDTLTGLLSGANLKITKTAFIAALDIAKTYTTAKTFEDTMFLLRNVADTFDGSFVNTNTADRIYTLQDAAGTLAFVTRSIVNITGTIAQFNTAITDGSIMPQETTINAQTGATYTLVLTDTTKLVKMTNASANTLTVPPNSSVAFATGTQITVAQNGAGQTTIAAGAGVTIRSADGDLKLRVIYSGATLIKLATDEWLLVGDITA